MRWRRLGGSLFGAALVAGLVAPVPDAAGAAAGATTVSLTSIPYRATSVDEVRAIASAGGDDTIWAGTTNGGGGGDFALMFHHHSTLQYGDDHATTDFGGTDDAANGVAVDSAGRITAVGTAGGDLAIARYLPTGQLDRSFDVDGRLTKDLGSGADGAYGVAAYPDGSALVVGGNATRAVLLRVLADGSIDAAFGAGGIVDQATGGPWRAVAVESDGGIVVVGGGPGFRISRYTPGGVPDWSTTVASDPGAVADAVVIQPDGAIVAAGASGGGAVAVRLSAAGALDSGFGVGGVVRADPSMTDIAYGVGVSPDGTVVIDGDGPGAVGFVAEYQPDGSPVAGGFGQSHIGASFRALTADASAGAGNRNGRFVPADVSPLAEPPPDDLGFAYPDQSGVDAVRLPDGKVIVLGVVSYDTALARLNADGTLDTTFGSGGRVQDDIVWEPTGIVRQPDGRMVVAGRVGAHPALAAFLPDGRVDVSFGVNGRVLLGEVGVPTPALAMYPDGRLVVQTGAAIARFTPAGQPDETFGTHGVVGDATPLASTWILRIALQADGKIVATNGAFRVVRLLADGARDNGFGAGGTAELAGGPLGDFTGVFDAALLVQPDGRILVGGFQLGGCPSASMARLLPDGSRDPSLHGTSHTVPPGCPLTGAEHLLVQPDGAVLATGSGGVVRFHPDGIVDAGYGNDGVAPTGMASGKRADGSGVDGGSLLLPNGDVLVVAHAPDARAIGIARVAAPAPWAPALIGVAPLGGAVLVSWAPPPAVPHAAIRAYEVTATGADGDHAAVTRDGSARGWPVRGLRPGMAYTFTVRALSPTGASDSSAPSAPAALAGGALMAGWGFNGVGEVGDGTTVSRPAPVAITGLTGVRSVAAGLYHSLALRNDGTVWAWGWNALGQLGDGTKVDRARPVQVSGLTNVVAVAAGAEHSLALKADGTVWAWGWNAVGQLGDGTTVDRSRPVQVAGLAGATAIAGGAGHSLAALADGRLQAWGWNAVGQLGDGTTVDRLTAVTVTTPIPLHATSVAAGWYHSAAVSDGGNLYTWGWNGVGQLGTGTTTDAHVPVAVGVGGPAASVAAGALHTVVVTSTGGVLAWGWNGYRQVANDPAAVIGTPRALAVPGPVSAVSAGAFHNLAVLDDGSVWGWGADGLGQLGDGGGPDRATPVRAAGLGFALAVAAGGAHSLVA